MKAAKLAILAVTVAMAVSAAAKEKLVFVEARAIKDTPLVALDPSKAYILLRSNSATPVYLSKLPTPADSAAYDKLRADELAKARSKYLKKLSEYEQAKSQPQASGAAIPEKPIEPTDAALKLTPFFVMAGVSIGPLNRFAKADGFSTYLHEVTPGTYRIYGMLNPLMASALFGSCFCMGSVKFEVKAGQIADLGLMIVHNAQLDRRPAGDSSAPLASTTIETKPAAMTLDPRLSNLPVHAADFRPAGKLPNYFGVVVERLPAMPGVMRYERDRIVDLTQGQ